MANQTGVAVVDFAVNAIMGISSGITAKAQTNANNTVNAANAYASNLVRAANNELRTSRNRLARYTQSENNARVLDNTGAALEASVLNYRRARDSAASDDFESQIAFSEQAGAQSAAAALSGLTGGVADIVNGTTALRKSRLQQRSDQAMKQNDWDAGQQVKQIAQAGWDSLDSSEISDDLDYSLDIAIKQVKSGNLFTEIMSGQSTQNMANAFSFNTPAPSANTSQQSFRQSEIRQQNAG
jgi:hypothetical protein